MSETEELLKDANTKMALRLADRLISNGFGEPDEDLAVLSKAVIQLYDALSVETGIAATPDQVGSTSDGVRTR